MPGLGSRLSTYCPTKRPKWKCNQHTSADQTKIPCVPVASPGLKSKGRVCMWRADVPALSNRARLIKLELQSHQMPRRRDWGPRRVDYPRNITNEMTTIRGQLNWWCPLNPPRANADTSTKSISPMELLQGLCFTTATHNNTVGGYLWEGLYYNSNKYVTFRQKKGGVGEDCMTKQCTCRRGIHTQTHSDKLTMQWDVVKRGFHGWRWRCGGLLTTAHVESVLQLLTTLNDLNRDNKMEN